MDPHTGKYFGFGGRSLRDLVAKIPRRRDEVGLRYRWSNTRLLAEVNCARSLENGYCESCVDVVLKYAANKSVEGLSMATVEELLEFVRSNVAHVEQRSKGLLSRVPDSSEDPSELQGEFNSCCREVKATFNSLLRKEFVPLAGRSSAYESLYERLSALRPNLDSAKEVIRLRFANLPPGA